MQMAGGLKESAREDRITMESAHMKKLIRQPRAVHKLFSTVFALLFLAGIAANVATAQESEDQGSYAIGLWGDLPYSTLQATVGVPNLIADMNKQNLAFTAHDGDLKSGSSECTDAVYTQALS
jgi:hypothetical protein